MVSCPGPRDTSLWLWLQFYKTTLKGFLLDLSLRCLHFPKSFSGLAGKARGHAGAGLCPSSSKLRSLPIGVVLPFCSLSKAWEATSLVTVLAGGEMGLWGEASDLMSSHPLISIGGRITGSCLDDRMWALGLVSALLVDRHHSPEWSWAHPIRIRALECHCDLPGSAASSPLGRHERQGQGVREHVHMGALGLWVTRWTIFEEKSS